MEKVAVFLVSLLLASDTVSVVTGVWSTVDEKSGKVISEVQLFQQGRKVFGRITALAEPTDRQGRPKICIKCPGPDKDRPIVGLLIIRDLSLDRNRYNGDRYNGGTIMDPESGKVYKAEVWPENGTLKVRGSFGAFSRTQTWVKTP
jgi:uncharacterized protein (DUF2147 family)